MLAWAYRVEAVDQDGRTRLIDTWPTEEAALSRLRDLQTRAEAAQREMGLWCAGLARLNSPMLGFGSSYQRILPRLLAAEEATHDM